MFKFELKIYWSDEDHAFIAEVPELPGGARSWYFAFGSA